MPNLNDLLHIDLRQRGLQLANEIYLEEFKKLNLSEISVPRDKVPYVKLVFERVKTYTGIKCPYCWVRHEKESTLSIEEPIRSNVDFYNCRNCDFNHYFTIPII
jgi:hypothetical protein